MVAGDDHDARLPGRLPGEIEVIAPHLAHASTAYRTSPFTSAAIVVCDHKAPEVSIWIGEGETIRAVDWPWTGPGFASTYAAIADALGLGAVAPGQRLEALARLAPDAAATWTKPMLGTGSGGTGHRSGPGRRDCRGSHRGSTRRTAAKGPRRPRPCWPSSAIASSTCSTEVRSRLGLAHLCLGGSLFRQSSMTTRAKLSGLFDGVFVPVDPGDAGLAVGAALHGLGAAPALASPFLGPAYDAEEIKAVLANCKLHYSWESEEGGVQAAVAALMAGRMVGWFDDAMEWGPRALGARSILASPFSPYVLENLNRFLKHREPWRGYSLSGLAADVHTHFDGPDRAPYMECDYRPRDPRAVPPRAAVGDRDAAAADGRRRRAAAVPPPARGLRRSQRPALPGQHLVQRLPRADRLQPPRRGARLLRLGARPAVDAAVRAQQVADPPRQTVRS